MTGTRSCCGGPAWPRTRRPAIRREPLDPAGRRGSRPCGAPPIAPSLQFAEKRTQGSSRVPDESLVVAQNRSGNAPSTVVKGFRRGSGSTWYLEGALLRTAHGAGSGTEEVRRRTRTAAEAGPSAGTPPTALRESAERGTTGNLSGRFINTPTSPQSPAPASQCLHATCRSSYIPFRNFSGLSSSGK